MGYYSGLIRRVIGLLAVYGAFLAATNLNTGISQIIDAHGRVTAEVQYRLQRRPERPTLYLEGFAAGVVRAESAMSLYTRGGHLFGPAVTVAAGLVIVWAAARRSAGIMSLRALHKD